MAALLAALLLVGCGETVDSTAPEGGREVTHSEGVTEVPAQPQKVVALGEEFLLSDLLALGVKPIASTATLGTEFSGIPEDETEGIEPLDVALLTPEDVGAMDPDLLLVDEFVLGQVGFDRLMKIAPTVPIPSEDWRGSLELLGEVVDNEDGAERLIDDHDDALEDAKASIEEGTQASVATAYPSEVVAWTDGPSTIPATLLDLGVELVPGADDDLGPLDAGRVPLSRERIDLLSAPTLLLLQTSGVEGEDAAVARLESAALYDQLPAVQNDRVVVLDRLGYPGVTGRIEAVEVLAGELAPAG